MDISYVNPSKKKSLNCTCIILHNPKFSSHLGVRLKTKAYPIYKTKDDLCKFRSELHATLHSYPPNYRPSCRFTVRIISATVNPL